MKKTGKINIEEGFRRTILLPKFRPSILHTHTDTNLSQRRKDKNPNFLDHRIFSETSANMYGGYRIQMLKERYLMRDMFSFFLICWSEAKLSGRFYLNFKVLQRRRTTGSK